MFKFCLKTSIGDGKSKQNAMKSGYLRQFLPRLCLRQHDIFYSISVANDSIRDKVGNPFPGLAVGLYAFRTVPWSPAIRAQKHMIIKICAVYYN